MRRLLFLSVLSLHLSTPCFELVTDNSKVAILTPSFKERKTSKIRLDNGLEAYIISDPLLKESGAALSVACGSWDDPVEYPGMAHFLEHMLFMGTKAYPDEAEYSSFIQSHGGAMNAYTASDKTVYSFSINPEDFEGALDRFSHFFIDPLFSRNSISRELHNVDQEHAKNVENDGSRLYMVFKHTANKQHPNHAFSTGNADTLSGIPQDVMKKFYEKYYSSERMHLVIMDKAPLDQLMASVKEKFSQVPVSKYDRKLPSEPILSEAQRGSLLTIKPLKATKSLSLVWEISDELVLDFDSMTARFISYLLSSEAKGQLADVLKSKGLINNLSSSKDVFSRKQGLISIDLDLSAKGLELQDEVINITFNYINRLLSTSHLQEIYNQWKSIITTRFSYQDRQDVFDQVTDLAADLIDEPLANFPSQGIIPTSFNDDKFKQLIKTMTPENCLFILLDQSVQADQKEPWTGAQYHLKHYTKDKLVAFSRVNDSYEFLPIELNPYAPTNFYLTSGSSESSFYETLSNQQNFKLFYRPTNSYGLPEVAVKIKLTPTLDLDKEPLNAFMNLLVQAYQRKLMFDLDSAAYCGLRGSLSYGDGSLKITVDGFNDKAGVLFTKMIDTLSNFTISNTDFELVKQSVKDACANSSKELGFRQGLLRFHSVFDSSYSLPTETLLELKTWDCDRFLSTCKKLSQQFYINALILGNANQEFAELVKNKLSSLVSSKKPSSANTVKVLSLDEQKGPFIYKKNLSVQGSSLILAIEQDQVSAASRAKTALLMPILSEQFFDTLRTKQHTGYIAKAFETEIAKQQFFLFGVQSNSHGALELLYRFELFLEDFVNNFDFRYSQEQFESIKASLIQEIKARKENLSVMASHDMAIICTRDADFNWEDKVLEALTSTSLEDIKEFAFKTLPRTNHKKVAFLMEGKLPENRKLSYAPGTLESIKLQGQFMPPAVLLPQLESDEYSKTLLQNQP